MKIAITAPVYIKNEKHLDYLDMTTESFFSLKHDLYWIPVINYWSPELLPIEFSVNNSVKDTLIVQGRQPQSVAAAWNDGVEYAGLSKYGTASADYVLIVNTDIVLQSHAIDKLVDFAESHPEAIVWTASEYVDLGLLEECEGDENFSEHPHFSCFLVKPSILEEVGRFDENFRPGYCEDADFHARIALLNKKAYIYGGAKFYHFGSRTIKEDRELWESNNKTFPACQQYFLDKWGHPIVNDVEDMKAKYYKRPYNNKEYTLKEWRQ